MWARLHVWARNLPARVLVGLAYRLGRAQAQAATAHHDRAGRTRGASIQILTDAKGARARAQGRKESHQ